MARPGPRRTLSEDHLLDAAQELLAAQGVAGLSVRKLAGAVGVAPNAVYTYFPDRAAVLAALVERVLGRAVERARSAVSGPGSAPGGADWRGRVLALATAVRTELLAEPGVVQLMAGVPPTGPSALAIGELLLEVLTGAGLAPAAAARGSYLLIVHVLGSVTLEVAELTEPGAPPPEEERVAARLRAFAEAVPAEQYPRTAELAPVIAEYVTTAQFEWGVERILDGLAAHAP
ncbi:TetR/AcrR family transcriptional regulator [Pseudonocardia sp. NPDC049154]|uniref:TetR/AcrR family transcriptional regulator n=1 Tax=Pseudonocardia sp. NPDC049154 TaxID=3155501 RepID=UPI0033F6E428